jgi:mono/diheme cytochrome c family protein
MRYPTIVVLCGALLWGCGTARRSEPLVGPPRITTESERHGQRLFMQLCNQCHPGGDAGLAPALNNKPAPAAAIKLQVRQGLGRMPSFPERELDGRGLDDLVSYVLRLRHTGR